MKSWREVTQREFDRMSESFGISHTSNIKYRNRVRAKARELVVGKHILDVGCGNGLLLRNMNSDISYVGIDLSVNMLGEASKIATAERIEEFILVQGDATHLPFKSASFDTVVCIDMMHHLPPDFISILLDELWRVARRQILLEVKNKLNPYLYLSYKRSTLKSGLVLNPVNPLTIKGYFKNKGAHKIDYHPATPGKLLAPFILLDIRKRDN